MLLPPFRCNGIHNTSHQRIADVIITIKTECGMLQLILMILPALDKCANQRIFWAEQKCCSPTWGIRYSQNWTFRSKLFATWLSIHPLEGKSSSRTWTTAKWFWAIGPVVLFNDLSYRWHLLLIVSLSRSVQVSYDFLFALAEWIGPVRYRSPSMSY